MAFLAWNVRRINQKDRRRDVRDFISKLSPSIVGLVESKVRPHKAYGISRSLPFGWDYVNNNAFANNGRIWLC